MYNHMLWNPLPLSVGLLTPPHPRCAALLRPLTLATLLHPESRIMEPDIVVAHPNSLDPRCLVAVPPDLLSPSPLSSPSLLIAHQDRTATTAVSVGFCFGVCTSLLLMVKAAFHLEETRFLLKIKLNKTFEKKPRD